jgi:hypothetical protein
MGYRATLYRNIAIPQLLYLVMGYSTFSLLYLIFSKNGLVSTVFSVMTLFSDCT